MSAEDYDRASVNLWVDHDRKATWEDYVEESPDLQHVSQLIRRSVEQEINGTSDSDVGMPPELDARLDEVVETVRQFERLVNRIDERLVTIEEAVRDNPDLRDLSNELFEVLPTRDEINDYRTLVNQAGSRPPENVVSAVRSGRIGDIARGVGQPESRVRQALEKLQTDTHRVRSIEIDDTQRFYKVV